MQKNSSFSDSLTTFWRLILCQTIFLLVKTAPIKALIKLPPNITVPALFGFGDSIIDPGNNNNNKLTMAKCNFPPYGKDFTGGTPTGRFSNGKISTDFIAEELSIKEYVPAYLDPSLQPADLLTGVIFASGGAGFDPLTSQLATCISLDQQLGYFKEYIRRVKSMVGEERTNFILENSLFLVVVGSDDIANTYFSTPIRRLHYDVDSYTDLMLNYASSFIQDVYGLGARRIAVFSAPPIGCVPSQRTIAGGIVRECVEEYNHAAQLFNSKLSVEAATLANKFNARIVYVDIYNPLLDFILNPDKYGFEQVTKGCCGTGLIEVTLLCNKFDALCADDTKYLFWDSYHPTQRGYQLLSSMLIQKYANQLY